MHTHTYLDYATRTIVACSLLHTLLPPWDWLDDFPAAQKYYKAMVYFIGYVGINGRSAVYRQLSVTNSQGPNTSPTAIDKKENENGGQQ